MLSSGIHSDVKVARIKEEKKIKHNSCQSYQKVIFCCFRYISRPFSHLQYTGKQLPPFYFIHFLLLLLNVQLLLRLILYGPSSQFNNSFKRKFLQLRCFVKVILKNTSNQHGIQHRRLGFEMYGQILLYQKLIYLLLLFFFLS